MLDPFLLIIGFNLGLWIAVADGIIALMEHVCIKVYRAFYPERS